MIEPKVYYSQDCYAKINPIQHWKLKEMRSYPTGIDFQFKSESFIQSVFIKLESIPSGEKRFRRMLLTARKKLVANHGNYPVHSIWYCHKLVRYEK